MIVSTTVILWLLFGAGALCAYMIGKQTQYMSRDEVIESTIMYMVENNLVKWQRDAKGEIELLEIDESS